MAVAVVTVVVASAHGLSAIVHAVIVIPSAIVVVAKSVLPYVVTEIGVVAVIVAA